MLVRELMTQQVVTTTPDAPVADALRLLDRHVITSIPVLDEHGRFVGIASEAGLLRGAVGDPAATSVVSACRSSRHRSASATS